MLLKESLIKQSHIVVIDDEPANVLFLQRLFEYDGYTRVTPLTSSCEALELCRFARPDIVLLDLNMPQMDGYALLEKLREECPPDDFVPILVFTADITPASRTRALQLGATDFLLKPGDATEICLRVYNFLRMRHLHREVLLQKDLLESRVTQRTRDLEAAQVASLHMLAKAAECRDGDTGDHVQRVGELAARLALALGCPPIAAEDMALAAPLHDVGKIGIPDAILLKPSRLNALEIEIMRGHAVMGHEILSHGPSPVLQLAASIALTHHERWDGTGYPRRLMGAQIPIEGRIVAVVDVFDALTTERPYKRAWPVEDALEEIRRCAGTHFDPKIVDAFMTLDHGLSILKTA